VISLTSVEPDPISPKSARYRIGFVPQSLLCLRPVWDLDDLAVCCGHSSFVISVREQNVHRVEIGEPIVNSKMAQGIARAS
jgi:hypothetical protein